MADKHITRREFLRTLTIAGFSGAAFSLSSCAREQREQFFQKHFLEMTDAEKQEMIKRLEDRYFKKYGRSFSISSQASRPHTLWGYGLTSRGASAAGVVFTLA